jgi:hypothetical protein
MQSLGEKLCSVDRYTPRVVLRRQRLPSLAERSMGFSKIDAERLSRGSFESARKRRGLTTIVPSEDRRDLECISVDATELFAERLHQLSELNPSASQPSIRD